MPYKFLLVKFKEDYNTPLTCTDGVLNPGIRKMLLSDICSEKIDLLYTCEDTSADKIIRESAVASTNFATYLLISIKMHDSATTRKNLLRRVVGHINRAPTASYVDIGANYQVITC